MEAPERDNRDNLLDHPVFFVGMPSLAVPGVVVRVTSLRFPSLRKLGDLYSRRLDLPSERC